MEKVFETHAHFKFAIPMPEMIEIFREEFAATGTEKVVFLALPHHSDGRDLTHEYTSNINGLFLKHTFSPNAYAFAGLDHTALSTVDEKTRAKCYEKQAEEYAAAGYDGMKMLEGYPSMRKAMGIPLCDKVYDDYYSFLEENNIPVRLHVANPPEYWDMSKVSDWVKKAGRACDDTYPTKAQLHEEVEEIMKKHPRLRMELAHFGFMSYDIEQAKRWMDDYENTIFDLTPGGEQLLNMGKNWDIWHDFFVKYQDRIIYGSDFYAFPKDEKWEENFQRRPKLVRNFFETDTEQEYRATEVTKFRGVLLEKDIREKIYHKNAERLYGAPKKIDMEYMKNKAEALLQVKDTTVKYADDDLRYILKNI